MVSTTAPGERPTSGIEIARYDAELAQRVRRRKDIATAAEEPGIIGPVEIERIEIDT